MLDKNVVLEAVKSDNLGYDRKVNMLLDNRDFRRLINFYTPADFEAFGYEKKPGADFSKWEQRPWTEDEFKKCLKQDVAFGYEKAMDERGLSTILMIEVVNMWLWILEDPLLEKQCELCQDKEKCGVIFLKQVAEKYGVEL
jgi:hypothetical protein